MEYSKLVAVTGLPGLFELVNSKADGAIVRSLDDKSTRFISSRIHNFSHLESIEVYTTGDNVNLVDVLNAMETAGDKLPDDKDAAAVKKYFQKVYPEMDFDRVYASDMKKMVKWFDVLKKNNVEIKLSEQPEEEIGDDQVDEALQEQIVEDLDKMVEEEPSEEKKATKKPAAKKAAPKKKKGE